MATVEFMEGKKYFINKKRVRGAKAKIQNSILKSKRRIIIVSPAKIDFGSLIINKKRKNVKLQKQRSNSHKARSGDVSKKSNKLENSSTDGSNQSSREGTLTRDIFHNVENKVTEQTVLSNNSNLLFSLSENFVERLALSPINNNTELITLSSDGSRQSSIEEYSFQSSAENPSIKRHFVETQKGHGSAEVEYHTIDGPMQQSKIFKNSSLGRKLKACSRKINSFEKPQESCSNILNESDISFSPTVTSSLKPFLSDSTKSFEGAGVVDHPTLNDVGKKCLEAVPIIFNQYFGIPLDTCFTTLVKNKYNILTTILELQNEATEPDDTLYDEESV